MNQFDFTVDVKGLSELGYKLAQAPNVIRDQVLQQGLVAGADVIIEQAQILAPKLTGRLAANIYSFKNKSSDADTQARGITVRSGKRYQKNDKDAFYWRWVEYGRGIVTVIHAKILGNEKKGFFGKSVRAEPAKPFMRPAYASKKEAAVDAFKDKLVEQVPIVLSRL